MTRPPAKGAGASHDQGRPPPSIRPSPDDEGRRLPPEMQLVHVAEARLAHQPGQRVGIGD
jgi:hypothetical protein